MKFSGLSFGGGLMSSIVFIFILIFYFYGDRIRPPANEKIKEIKAACAGLD